MGWGQMRLTFFIVTLLGLCWSTDSDTDSRQPDDHSKNHSGHTNNWAVLVCTSAFWFNYRHVANVLSVYRMAKGLGIPDDHIILMLADDMACNGRNIYQGQVFGSLEKTFNLYGDDVEVDYRGCEVTVEMFIRLLTNRLPPEFPKSKRLLTDSGSNILVFMTGHGGDNFLKFQDSEEINAYDIADAFDQMWTMNRYNEILFIIDTCQASTMYERFKSPNIMAISSSMRGESSYSYHVDDEIGVAIIDRFTFALLNFLKDLGLHSNKTVGEFMDSLDTGFLGSTPELRKDLFGRLPDQVKLIDFFGNVQPVIVGSKPFIATLAKNQAPRPTQEESSDEEEHDSVANEDTILFETFDLLGKQRKETAPSFYISGLIGTIGIGLLATSIFYA